MTKININLPCKSCYFLVNTKNKITVSINFKLYFDSKSLSKNSYYWTFIKNGNTKLCFCNLNFLIGHIELEILSLSNQIIKYSLNNNILYILIFDKLLSLLELCYFKTLSSTLIQVNNINLINFKFEQKLLKLATSILLDYTETCNCIYKKEFTLLTNFLINNYIKPYYKIHKYNFLILQYTLQKELYQNLYFLQRNSNNCFQFSNNQLFYSLYHAKRLANISQKYENYNWNNNMICIFKIPNIYLLYDNQKLYSNNNLSIFDKFIN